MSVFFDSSLLIAALMEDEPHHKLCREALDHSIAEASALAAQHLLAEVFHTLTGRKGVPPQQAAQLLRHNFRLLRWLALGEKDYWYCVESAHRWGIRGGAIFDLLLLRAAENHKVARIHTLNTRHFISFAPHLRERITGPAN